MECSIKFNTARIVVYTYLDQLIEKYKNMPSIITHTYNYMYLSYGEVIKCHTFISVVVIELSVRCITGPVFLSIYIEKCRP